MTDYFKVPGRKDDMKDQVESLYQYVSKLNKELNFILSNIDTINLSAELASQISVGAGKNTIFSVQPAPPYVLGDIWIGTDFIKKCTTARETGSYTSGDWAVVTGTIALLTATQTMTNKELTTPVISTFYKDTNKTKLMTVPDVASDTIALLAAVQTMTDKTFTAPVITDPDITHKQTSHDYGGAASDWTLSAAEMKAETLIVTNSNGAANIIAPSTAGKLYKIVNDTGYNIVIKKSGGTGVTIATGKIAAVEYIGTDYRRLTADV